MTLSFVCVSATAQQSHWFEEIREVSLLHSTYQDIIRIYDLESKVHGDQGAFQRYLWQIDSADGSTQVLFKDGVPCVDGSTIMPGWNVAEWTVVGVDFYPNWKKQITFDQLPFRMLTFKDFTESDNHFRYWDSDQGISVELDAKKRVRAVHFFPSDSLSFMRCLGNSSVDYRITFTRVSLPI